MMLKGYNYKDIFVYKFIVFSYFKYHRFLYYIKYNIPFFDTNVEEKKVINYEKIFNNVRSVSIIGKGASIFNSNPKNIIEKTDFKIIMNSVDVEYLENYLGSKFDLQITTHIAKVNSIIPVLNRRLIKKYGIKFLMCNNSLDHNNGITFKDYWNYFNNRVDYISYVPDFSILEYSPDLNKYGPRLTMASSVILMLYNIKTINKIVFVGVDAFHYGYSYRPDIKETDRHFYPINEGGYNDPKSSHGIPFLNFLFATIEEVNIIRDLDLYFPEILKKHINFPNKNYIKFYK